MLFPQVRRPRSTSLRWAVAALAVALLAVLSPLARPAGAVSAAPAPPVVGVNWHAVWGSYTDAQRVQVLDAMQAAGLRSVRIDVGWDMLEPTASGQHDAYWTGRVDAYVNMAVAHGLTPLVMLYQTPAWARPTGTGSNSPPTDPATFAAFAGWAAGHFAHRVGSWEIWNEPNQEGFWHNPDPAAYAQLVRAAYPAIKTADPSALVVAGAVSYNDVPFLSGMYAAGVRGSFDVLSTHPYLGPADAAPETANDGTIWTLRHVQAVHDLMVAQGDAAKPVWFTELGWSTHANTGSEPPWLRGVSDQTQADYVVRSVQLVAAEYPYVKAVYFYNERDRTDADVQNDNYGLLHSDLTVKPSYTALKAYLVAAVPPSPTPTPTTSPTAAPSPSTSPSTTASPSTSPAPLTSPAPTCCSGNLLAGDQAVFSTTTGGWSPAITGVHVGWRSTPSASSTGSLELGRSNIPVRPGPLAMTSGSRRPAVSPGHSYTGSIRGQAISTGRTVSIFVNWFSASGAFLSQSASSGPDVPGTWSPVQVRATAPAGAASASLTVQVEAVPGLERHLFDDAGLVAAS